MNIIYIYIYMSKIEKKQFMRLFERKRDFAPRIIFHPGITQTSNCIVLVFENY